MNTIPLPEIIEAAGGVTKLCDIADVSRQALAKWTRVPAERVLRIERATGIPRHRMRPDLYPPEEYAA